MTKLERRRRANGQSKLSETVMRLLEMGIKIMSDPRIKLRRIHDKA